MQRGSSVFFSVRFEWRRLEFTRANSPGNRVSGTRVHGASKSASRKRRRASSILANSPRWLLGLSRLRGRILFFVTPLHDFRKYYSQHPQTTLAPSFLRGFARPSARRATSCCAITCRTHYLALGGKGRIAGFCSPDLDPEARRYGGRIGVLMAPPDNAVHFQRIAWPRPRTRPQHAAIRMRPTAAAEMTIAAMRPSSL